jgi:hypothetical protein
MKHPPYHLRPNKAVDRLLLVDVITILREKRDFGEYTYYGFGGPYLEEFRLLYELCPDIKMVSLERNEETLKRQAFHLPCGKVKLLKADAGTFLAQHDFDDEKSVFWLDYTDLEYSAFDNFMALLRKIPAGSIVKVTLPAESGEYFDKPETFKLDFGAVLPSQSAGPPREFEDFALLLQRMLRIAAQRALPSQTGMTFQPASSFFYKDGARMFTLTGVVCTPGEARQVRERLRHWRFANVSWRKPRRIDVPYLSTKERLHLQRRLPCVNDPGRRLYKALGYNIDAGRIESIRKMKQYADFHRYFPYFMKAIP